MLFVLQGGFFYLIQDKNSQFLGALAAIALLIFSVRVDCLAALDEPAIGLITT